MQYTKLNYEGFERYFKNISIEFLGGFRYVFKFPNGYGASVIKHFASYGNEQDLFELAVLKDGNLCYTTPITNDVIGYLNNDEVLELLERIKSL